MSVGYWETLSTVASDGTAVTATARTSLLSSGAKTGLYTMAPNRLKIGDVLHIRAAGRISCTVTTPGTARFDLSWGVGGTAGFDSLAISLNTTAQTNVPWVLDAEMIVRANGSSGNLFGLGFWLSAAGLNVATVSTGPGPGGAVIPYNTAPVVGSTVDMSIAQILDFNFTQTVATGSITLHNYVLSLKTSSGF